MGDLAKDLAKKFFARCAGDLVSPMAVDTPTGVKILGIQQHPKCKKCPKGCGRLLDGSYCDCYMAKELARIEKRKASPPGNLDDSQATGAPKR